ncbi:MAG: TolC family protein [Coleofasciculus sp. Co-bin14]|nr:TolC family protein [Coleofasciculus sp. Co-bin14]
MQKNSNHGSQRPNLRDYLSSPIVSVLTLKLVSVLIAVLGTACAFALASKPQYLSKPVASVETALKQPIAKPTASEPLAKTSPELKVKRTQRGTNKAFNSQLSLQTPNFSPSKQETTSSLNPLNSSVRLYSLLGIFDLAQPKKNPNQNNLQIKESQEIILETRDEITSSLRSSDNPAFPSSPALKPVQPLPTPSTPPVAQIKSQAQLQNGQQSSQLDETNPQQNQPKPVPEVRAVQLTLSDVVILALENNRSIKNAYLERIAQRQDLAVAESKFDPNFTPTVSISLAQFGSNRPTTNSDVGLEATVKVPTGGQLSFRWATNAQTLNSNGSILDPIDNGFGQNLQLSFKQPLLRGAGVNVNKASIDIARLTEQINILDLKSTLSNIITDAIVAYRELLRTQERLKIAQLSLKSAQDFLEINQALIEAGRLAPVDIVQSETDVANRQVSLIEGENSFDAARLALLNILDIDQNVAIVPAEVLTASAVALDSNKFMQLALANQPEYLKAQLDIDRTKLTLLQAQNNRLWDLSLNTSYGYDSNSTSDVRAGLGLSYEFGNLTAEQDFQRSRVNQLQAENTLQEQRKSLELKVTDSIRDARLSFAQVELARKATQLSERQLEIAREKQKLGRPITVFELVRLQNDLVQARNQELNAMISYLNALTRLDQTLGTTLDTWQVTIDRK